MASWPHGFWETPGESIWILGILLSRNFGSYSCALPKPNPDCAPLQPNAAPDLDVWVNPYENLSFNKSV